MSDISLQRTEAFIAVALIVGFALTYAVRRLRRTRPGFNIGVPIAFAVILRLWAVVAINTTSVQSQLRGGDESTFLDYARGIAATPWGRGNLPHGHYQLHTEIFAAQLKLLPISNTGLRMTQIGLSMLGIVLIVAAVYDLAGPRAARLAAWVSAFEPSNIFFNSALHKEPLMVLASGLVVFGGTKIWHRLSPSGVLLAAFGGLIAVETRSYAGWFLVSAAVIVVLFVALRHLDRPLAAMPVVYAVCLTVFLATPTLLSATSKKSLQTLQQSQNANTQGTGTGSSASNRNNLALEKVDFSSRGAVIKNLPKRILDLTTKPYPWQVQNISQQLGALGALIWFFGLALLFRYAWASRGHILQVTAPILWPTLFLLVAYSLSAGNAGTGFRYRSHLVLLGIALIAGLRARAEQTETERAATPLIRQNLADRAALPA